MFNNPFVQIRPNGSKLRSKMATFIDKTDDFQHKIGLKKGSDVLEIQFFTKIMLAGGLVARLV